MSSNRLFLSVNIPFPGFYESSLSYELDNAEEMMCGEDSNELNAEEEHPEDVRLSASELSECLFDAMDYNVAHDFMARAYVESFNYVAGEILGLTGSAIVRQWDDDFARPQKAPSLHITFEEIVSPREYNFTTDRLFVKMPAAVMWRLFKRSEANNHDTLAKVIRERFTSYNGFASFYSNDIETWLNKPWIEWDHNELGTLLIAALHLADSDYKDTLRYDIAESMNESAYSAVDKACDWNKFEELKAEKRADKAASVEA